MRDVIPPLAGLCESIRLRPLNANDPEHTVRQIDPSLTYDGWMSHRERLALYRVRTSEGVVAALKVSLDHTALRFAPTEHRCVRDLTASEVPGIPKFLRAYWPEPDKEGYVALLRSYIAGEPLNARRRDDTVFDHLHETAIRMLGAKYTLPADFHHEQIIIDGNGMPYVIDLEEVEQCAGFSRELYERNVDLIALLRKDHERVVKGENPRAFWQRVLLWT